MSDSRIPDGVFASELVKLLLQVAWADHEVAPAEAAALLAFARVFLQVGELLVPEDRPTYASLAADALVPFLAERGIDIHAMLIEESIRYRQELIYTFTTGHSEYFEETPEEAAALAA